jgi:hypothetical protein
MTLVSYVLLTPFIQPRAWWRFMWTYLVPVVPLATCWDGVVSFIRGYSPQALAERQDHGYQVLGDRWHPPEHPEYT